MAETTYVTPYGIAQYPWLTTEDPQYGKYKLMLKLTDAELKEFKKAAEAFVKENFKGKKIKGLPLKEHEDLGTCIYTTSKYKPVLLNAKKESLQLEEGQYVGSGSTLRILGQFKIANDYCVFYVKKVQVKELVSAAGGDSGFPDDDEDEGPTEDDVDPFDI